MSIGGIGSDLPVAIPDPLGAAEAAAPAVLPEPPAPPAPALLADAFAEAPTQPSAQARMAGDVFTPVAAAPAPAPAPTPMQVVKKMFGAAEPALDRLDAATDRQVTAARQDLSSARQDLRQARRQVARAEPGTARKANARENLQEARQDLRAARADLAGARRVDAAVDAVERRIDAIDPAGTQGALLPEITADNFAAPEALGLPETLGLDETGPAAHGQALGRDLPVISQLNPAGRAFGYQNAEMNCAPAVMAMVARGLPGAVLDGKPVDQMPDAQLINRLGRHGQTDALGTSPNGVIAMAEELGLATTTQYGVGFDQGYYDSILARGGTVVANGAMEINGEMAGHFMLVTGKTTDGNYRLNDPWTGQTLTYTPAQLDAFLRANEVYPGGVSIGMW